MKKVKKETQTDVSAVGYTAPTVKVVKVRTRSMMCQSPSPTSSNGEVDDL